MKRIIAFILCAYCLTSLAQVPAYVPTNGLVGYWPFNNNANDQSINNNNGTVNGALPTTDRFSNPNAAYNFNGTSDYISVADNPSLSGFNDMSISFWVKINQFSGIQAVVSKWFYTLNCGSNTDNYTTAFAGNTINFATNNNNGSGFSSTQTFTTSDLNVWKHFAFISKATQGQYIYVNGVLSGSTALTGSVCNSTNPLIFGAAISTFRFFGGGLDDIGIWNRALTPCEITQLYNSGAGASTISSSSNSICAGSSVTLTANSSGATNYLWNTSATSSAIVVSPSVTTIYTVSATNTVTGCSYTAAITQSVSPVNLNITSSNSITCSGNAATLTANGNSTSYFWNTSATTSVIAVSPTVTTSYTVFGTNAVSGCTASAAITQSVATLNLSTTTSNSLICPGNPATLTVNGNATSYFWNTSATASVIVVNPTVTTTYTVFATNAVTGCTATAVIMQNVSLCTGLKNSIMDNEIEIYPNPTSGIVFLDMIDETTEIEVTNSLGKVIYKNKTASNKQEVDLSRQINGVYFIKLKTANGTVIKKIIKE